MDINKEIKLAAERAYPMDRLLREAFEKGANCALSLTMNVIDKPIKFMNEQQKSEIKESYNLIQSITKE